MDFRRWIAISEIFGLAHARLGLLGETKWIDPVKYALDDIEKAKTQYQPGPHPDTHTHLAAVVAGRKPAAVVRYAHHPAHPAVDVVPPTLHKGDDSVGHVQAVQLQKALERLRAEFGDEAANRFKIKYIGLPGYNQRDIIVGQTEAVEELHQLLRLQRWLDLLSSVGEESFSKKQIEQVRQWMKGEGLGSCSLTGNGINCRPLHRRIGELLGYTPAQVDEFLHGPGGLGDTGYDHLPDVPYDVEIPKSLSGVPRRKGFRPRPVSRA